MNDDSTVCGNRLGRIGSGGAREAVLVDGHAEGGPVVVRVWTATPAAGSPVCSRSPPSRSRSSRVWTPRMVTYTAARRTGDVGKLGLSRVTGGRTFCALSRMSIDPVRDRGARRVESSTGQGRRVCAGAVRSVCRHIPVGYRCCRSRSVAHSRRLLDIRPADDRTRKVMRELRSRWI